MHRISINFPGSLQISNSISEDQGKYECVAENSIGTEHSKPTSLYVKVRRVPPQFSRPPESLNEVVLGANLSLTCIAVGSPMPFVKWKKGNVDITPEDEIPVGRNILELTNIVNSANYTCIAASTLGQIEASAVVKVQCKLFYVMLSFLCLHLCVLTAPPERNNIQIVLSIVKVSSVWKI